jgi:cytochrome c oxidase subunit 3
MPAVSPTALAHQFEDLEQQHEVSALGMWAFLATELMVFGGLFTGYVVYRALYPAAFETGSRHLNIMFGAVNTVVLLTSSLTMALGVWAAQTGWQKMLARCLALTALLGATFLVVKGFEYYEDYRDNLIPGFAFEDSEWTAPEALASPAGTGTLAGQAAAQEQALFPQRVKLFFVFYYVMTGLHALHLIIGIGILVALVVLARRGRFSPQYCSPVDVGALYWHFVDVVWIFLLPLLYLIGTRQGTH